MEYWLTQAKMLRFGQHRKIQCCASDQSMRIENDAKGYRGFCFRCKQSKFEAHGTFSLAELRQRQTDLESVHNSTEISLPSDLTKEMPGYAAAWLLRAGIPLLLAEKYCIRYSPKLDRVVLPVYRNGALAAYTMRSVSDKPKYIERQVDEAVIFVSDPTTILEPEQAGSYGCDIVVTEDILSAIRVGRIVPAFALLGTSVGDAKVAGLLEQTQRYWSRAKGHRHEEDVLRIGVWLDSDKAGRIAARRLARRLTLQGYSVSNIKTDKDPKRYSNREIKEILSDRRYLASTDEVEEGI
jgi:hypothetical protein